MKYILLISSLFIFLSALKHTSESRNIVVDFYLYKEKNEKEYIFDIYENIHNNSNKNWFVTYNSSSQVTANKDSSYFLIEKNAFGASYSRFSNEPDTLYYPLPLINIRMQSTGRSGIHKIITIKPNKSILLHYRKDYRTDKVDTSAPKYIKCLYALFSEPNKPEEIAYRFSQPHCIPFFWEKYNKSTYIIKEIVLDAR
jgi:hypothetical protein